MLRLGMVGLASRRCCTDCCQTNPPYILEHVDVSGGERVCMCVTGRRRWRG